MRTLATILVLLLCLAPARAEDAPKKAPAKKAPPAKAPPKPLATEQAADAVLKAVEAKDDKALKALAERDAPDPWLVADELCRRGAHGAAEAFARSAPRPDLRKLPAYVATRRGKSETKLRETLSTVTKAFEAQAWQEVLDATRGTGKPLDTVVRIRIASSLGWALRQIRKYPESATVLREAGDAAAQLGWLLRADGAYYDSGVSSYLHSDWDATLKTWQLLLSVQTSADDSEGMGITYGNMGLVLLKRGDYEGAKKRMIAALEIAREHDDEIGVSRIEGNLGDLYRRLGQHDESEASLLRALVIARKRKDYNTHMAALSSLGLLQDRLGDYDAALRYLEAGLALARKHGNTRAEGIVLGSVGSIHDARGDFAKALSIYERALELKTKEGNVAGVAVTLDNIAGIYASIGHLDKALRYYRRSLAIEENLGNLGGRAITLGNIGSVQRQQGELDAALATQLEALRLKQQLGDPLQEALTLSNIGAIHAQTGDATQALEYWERARALRERIKDRVGAATTLYNIAWVHSQRGEYAEAQALHERGRELAAEAGAVRPLVLNLWGIARNQFGRGLMKEATITGRRAIKRMRFLLRGLGGEEASMARERWDEGYNIAIRAGAAVPDPAEVAFFMESARAGALLESLGAREKLGPALLPDALRRAEAGARSREHLARARLDRARRRGSLADARAARAALKEAQTAREDVISRIQRTHKAAASIAYPQSDELPRIQANLRSKGVLLLYALTDAAALVVIAGPESARLVPLANSTEIAKAARALSTGGRGGLSEPAIAKLRRLLVEPLRLSQGTRRVLVSPAGPLGYVPFSLLMPGKEIAYVPSGTTYGLLRSFRTARGTGVLALGDPDYTTAVGSAAAGVHRGGAGLPPLPATLKEVEAVGTVRLLGKQATESGLRRALGEKSRWRAVHFACHGLVDPDRPELSSLALTADDLDDGFLSCMDIFRLRVPADLVVLSACETGKGKIYKTEGIVGLTRAFMFAGAPRVICSLWKVDDEATQALMIKFYELWNPKDGQGLGAAAALKRAQEHVRTFKDKDGRALWKHPYYWAAWVLWGLPN